MRSDWKLLGIVLLCSLAILACGDSDRDADSPTDPGGGDPPLVVDGTCADAACVEQFDLIPPAVVAAVGELHVYYGHTSHGSQLATGLDMLEAADPAYAPPTLYEPGDDLGTGGDVSWVAPTRAYLDAHPGEVDVVMWSWCGGVSTNTPAGIDTYLAAMNQLETDYPGVVFVYMTGHLDGSGPGGTLYANNDRIRAYCAANEKWFYDFADIESDDPDGNHYPDETDACGWCEDWCATHDCPECGACAHSHCFNCWQKGKALWWLLGRVVGWEEG